jgi:hypothetical protein
MLLEKQLCFPSEDGHKSEIINNSAHEKRDP